MGGPTSKELHWFPCIPLDVPIFDSPGWTYDHMISLNNPGKQGKSFCIFPRSKCNFKMPFYKKDAKRCHDLFHNSQKSRLYRWHHRIKYLHCHCISLCGLCPLCHPWFRNLDPLRNMGWLFVSRYGLSLSLFAVMLSEWLGIVWTQWKLHHPAFLPVNPGKSGKMNFFRVLAWLLFLSILGAFYAFCEIFNTIGTIPQKIYGCLLGWYSIFRISHKFPLDNTCYLKSSHKQDIDMIQWSFHQIPTILLQIYYI